MTFFAPRQLNDLDSIISASLIRDYQRAVYIALLAVTVFSL